MTEKQLRKFIKIRNASNFDSNIQFQFDAQAAGFNVNELGKANKHQNPKVGQSFYWWDTPFGILVERYGDLRLFRRTQ